MKKIDEINIKKSINNKLDNLQKKHQDVSIENLPLYNIFFIGFMGVGKTTVSSYLSNLLSRKKIDIDQCIAKREKMKIPEIFKKYGEEYFRNCETEVLKDLNSEDGVIISCGGGIVLKEENISLMKERGKIILLTSTPQTIFERVRYSDERPILNNNMNVDFISELMKKREENYLHAADLIIDTDKKSIEEVCEEIISSLNKMDI